MLVLLITLVVLVVLWFVFKPTWAPKPPDTTEWVQKASEASKQATASAGQMYDGLRGRMKLRGDTRELAKQFKQWVSEGAFGKRDELYKNLPASAEGFAAWLGGLSQKELEGFTQSVARFCATLNFDIAWLTDPEVAREPDLKRAVEDAALLYSLAAWRAHGVQREVKGFLAYRAWLANPAKQQAFGRQLHGILVERGLVTVPPALYLAPEKERFEQAIAEIRKVATEHPAEFNAAVRQISVAGAKEPAAAPTETPAPVPPVATKDPAVAVPTGKAAATSA